MSWWSCEDNEIAMLKSGRDTTSRKKKACSFQMSTACIFVNFHSMQRQVLLMES